MFKISLGGASLPHDGFYPTWTILIDSMQRTGLCIGDIADFHVSLDHEEAAYQKFLREGGHPRNAILVRQETDTVFPGQYSPRIEKKYGLILTFGATRNLRNSAPALGHPYVHSKNPTYRTKNEENSLAIYESRLSGNTFELTNWKKRKTLISYIGGNKVGLNSSGNYEYRRTLVASLIPKGLMVYGPHWNDSFWRKFYNRSATFAWGFRSRQIPSFFHIYGDLFTKYVGALGSIPEKDSVLLESKFTLIIENSSEILTEKLYDAILAGTIPVYFGPALEEYGLPNDIAIEIGRNEKEIISKITQMSDEEIRSYLKGITTFLSDQSQYRKWVAEHVYQDTALIIHNYIKQEANRIFDKE